MGFPQSTLEKDTFRKEQPAKATGVCVWCDLEAFSGAILGALGEECAFLANSATVIVS